MSEREQFHPLIKADGGAMGAKTLSIEPDPDCSSHSFAGSVTPSATDLEEVQTSPPEGEIENAADAPHVFGMDHTADPFTSGPSRSSARRFASLPVTASGRKLKVRRPIGFDDIAEWRRSANLRRTMATCWLYVYKNAGRNAIYIGIANSMRRVFEKHNAAAEELRDAPGTVILQTIEPFSSREDAEKAEAIAIHVASFAGTKVMHDEGGSAVFTTTNIAGVGSTKHLGPAILTRDGVVQQSELSGTMIVPITADEIDGRLAPFGAHRVASFATRAQKYWKVAEAKRPKVVRLLAVLTGSGNIILGDWDVDPDGDWRPAGVEPPYISVPLIDPEQDDPREEKGMRLVGHRMNSGVTYSSDLRAPGGG